MRRGFNISLFILLNLLSLFAVLVSYGQSRKVDLTGNWVGKGTKFLIDNRGCTAGYSGRIETDGQDVDRGVEFKVTQKGNQVIIPDQLITWSNGGRNGSYTMTYKVSLSGNTIKIISSGDLEGGFTKESLGTISADGNTIVGKVLCRGVRGSATAEGTFTWTKKVEAVDPRSEAVISKLNPQVQPYARELVRKSALNGTQIRVISGLRTYKEQDALYCQGRNIPYCNSLYKPGKIVPNAKGGYSNHNFGIAFDIGIFDGNKYLPESPKYNEVGKIGKELGLEWGGDWKTTQDRPHFQLRPKWATELSESKMLEELRRRTEKNEQFYP